MKVKIEPLDMHADHRGFVFEPIDKGSLIAQENCHVVISDPGVIRGNHYHLMGTETMAVAGPALVMFKEATKIHDVEIPAHQVFKFVFPPRTAHAVKNTGKRANILVAFNSHAHNPRNPDVVKEILM